MSPLSTPLICCRAWEVTILVIVLSSESSMKSHPRTNNAKHRDANMTLGYPFFTFQRHHFKAYYFCLCLKQLGLCSNTRTDYMGGFFFFKKMCAYLNQGLNAILWIDLYLWSIILKKKSMKSSESKEYGKKLQVWDNKGTETAWVTGLLSLVFLWVRVVYTVCALMHASVWGMYTLSHSQKQNTYSYSKPQEPTKKDQLEQILSFPGMDGVLVSSRVSRLCGFPCFLNSYSANSC